jgi:hypothetical protein
MDKEKYLSSIYKELVKNIPNELEDEFKEGLKSKIKFGYEYSLRRRIKELFRANDNFINNFVIESDVLQKKLLKHAII